MHQKTKIPQDVKPEPNGSQPSELYLARLKQLEAEKAKLDKIVKCSIEIMTPERFGKLLEADHANRRPRNNEIRSIRDQIDRGDYVFNGQPVIIGQSGQPLDVQHRAMACIQAGLPILSLVVYGVPDQARDTMDTGSSRSAADELQFSGRQNTIFLAAAARACLLVEARDKNITRYIAAPTISRYAKQYPELEKSAHAAASLYRPYPSKAYIGALHFKFAQLDQKLNETFWEGLKSGEGLNHGNPILALRHYCETIAYHKRWDYRGPLLCFTILAWNALREGREIKAFKISTYNALDLIPKIV